MKQIEIIYIPTVEMAIDSRTKGLLTPGYLEFQYIIDM